MHRSQQRSKEEVLGNDCFPGENGWQALPWLAAGWVLVALWPFGWSLFVGLLACS